MTIWADFEEKTYEKYFGHELRLHPKHTFSPGQYDEFHLGFDEAFRVPWRRLFFQFPHLLPRWWKTLPGVTFSDIEHLFEEVSRALPPFKFNLFVQFKRPEYVMGHMAAEWRHWKAPYYRYKIIKHQHAALVSIQQHAVGRAAVVYASAVFLKTEDLFRNAETGQIISQSNIASVDKIKLDHQTFTYRAPGGFGISCSEPEEITSLTLEKIVQIGLEQPEIPFRDHILKTARLIDAAVAENLQSRAIFENARRTILYLWGGEGEEAKPDSFVFSLATIEAFSDVFDVTLWAMG